MDECLYKFTMEVGVISVKYGKCKEYVKKKEW
ncbi:hypothetical protein CN907_04065 [Bacillus anthracis]|uniref:Uncharacterized protein n=1 Tax=Bacillus fungorum TaxID=2039284 RepID=A0A2G6Q5T7_9BACI|nr:hypothetical protein CN907_04065 [Bacillus anthracis]PIE92105.1 hypothetical protein CO726_28360 [Bacillus fungorum]